MRLILLLLLLSCCISGRAQVHPDSALTRTEVSVVPHELLTAVAWEEVDRSINPGYLLLLSKEGNFNEDAGINHKRSYQNLLGRWQLDTAQTRLTLSVDGFMGKGMLSSRYLRGRDYHLTYDIVDVSPNELIIKDIQTGKKRIYIATDPTRLEDQSEKRKPKASMPDTTTWSLPDFGGGQ